jgi:glycosyltransferase involved in cell wall biosynthesis
MVKFRRIVASCDLIFAGNSFLRDEALKFASQDRVFVIPTVVDLDLYPMREGGGSDEPLTIGWIGSAGTIHYVEKIMPALETVAKRFPSVQLKIVGDRFLDSKVLRIVKKQWTESEETEDLHSFDIGIMPLTDDLWAQGKCALKIVQYLAVGVPVVCSPVGANRDIVEDGTNGFWAEDEGQWIERLSTLVQDARLRERMGRTGRQIVEEGYSLDAVGTRLVRLIRDIRSE